MGFILYFMRQLRFVFSEIELEIEGDSSSWSALYMIYKQSRNAEEKL